MSVPLADTGDTKVTLSMSEANTYADPALAEKTYTSRTYTILVHKSTSDKVSFQVTPEDAVISVYDKRWGAPYPFRRFPDDCENILRRKPIPGIFLNMAIFPKQGSFTSGEISVSQELVKQDATQPEITDNDWINFRNSIEQRHYQEAAPRPVRIPPC